MVKSLTSNYWYGEDIFIMRVIPLTFIYSTKAQYVVPEGEWEEFLACMKQNLPAAFRLTGTKDMACALLRVMKTTFFEPLSQITPPELTPEEKEAGEEPVKPLKPFCLPWCVYWIYLSNV